MIDEEPDAAKAIGVPTVPDDASLKPGLEVYWRGWHDLRNDRAYFGTGGEGAIQFSAIDRYAFRMGIADADFDIFRTLVSAADGEYLKWLAEKRTPPP